MFHIVQNNKIITGSSQYCHCDGGITIKKDFTEEEMIKINNGYNIELIENGIVTYEVNEEIEMIVEIKMPDGKIQKRGIKEIGRVEKEMKNYDVKFIESIESKQHEKEQDIKKYQEIKKEIAEIKSEINEINETYNTYNIDGKKIADMQLTALKDKIQEVRENKNMFVLEGIKKYGKTILQELI